MKRNLYISSFVGLILTLSMCQKEDSIKIGHITPLTGDVAVYGEWESQGVDLAVEEINNQGGIAGKKIVIIREDSQADPRVGVSGINKLIKVDKVHAIIGAASSTVTLACAPIAEKNHTVLISAVSASTEISNAGDYIFRVFPTNVHEADKLINVSQNLKAHKLAILFVNNDFGIELANLTRDKFENLGGKVLLAEAYERENTDFRTLLSKVKSLSPHLVIILGYPKDMALLCKQSKEIGVKVQFLAPDTFYTPEIIDWSEGAVEGVIFVTPSNGVEERWDQFQKKIKDKYNKESNIASAMAYDSMNLLAEAMRIGGFGNEEIKDSLYEIKQYPGITGDITFDKNGDVENRLMDIYIVKNGKFVRYKLEE